MFEGLQQGGKETGGVEAESARRDHDFAIHKVLALLALHIYICAHICALIPYHWGVVTPKTKGD